MSSSSTPSRQSWFRSGAAEVTSPARDDQGQESAGQIREEGARLRMPLPGSGPNQTQKKPGPSAKLAGLFARISWAAALVLLIGLAGTLVVWRFVQASERTHVGKMTSLAASAIHPDIESDMQTWILGQVRLAKLWEFGETQKEWSAFASTYEQWSAFAKLYIEHHPGCLAIEWLDPKYEERWLVRPRGITPVPLAGSDVHDFLLRKAQESGQPIVSPILTSAQGRKQWQVIVPIFQKDRLQQTRFRGYVLGFFDAQESLDGMLDDVKGLGFSAALREGEKEFYRLPASNPEYEKKWAQNSNVTVPGSGWQLSVWPRHEGMGELRSSLPLATLLSGVLLSLLLSVTVQANHDLRLGIAERRRAETALAASQARFAGILEISAEAVISMDQGHRITLYNQAAEAIFGYSPQEVMGKPVEMLIPQRFRDSHKKHVAEFADSQQHNLLMGERRTVSGMRKDGSEFPMAASVSKLDLGGEKIFTIICSDVTDQVRAEEELRRAHDDLERRVQERTADLARTNVVLQDEISERKLAEEEVRKLSARVMLVQDEERRHLARELHDGTTQNLVAIALNLATARDAALPDPVAHDRVVESLRLAEQCATELRTISYLLHPPLLEELGLGRALRGYVDGFTKRSGIEVTLKAQPELGHLGFEVELTVFRIVQEALANIHRHSQSGSAVITLVRDGDGVILEIADQGRGMPKGNSSAGVGLASMRERVRLLRGRLEITSGPRGTTIRAFLPTA